MIAPKWWCPVVQSTGVCTVMMFDLYKLRMGKLYPHTGMFLRMRIHWLMSWDIIAQETLDFYKLWMNGLVFELITPNFKIGGGDKKVWYICIMVRLYWMTWTLKILKQTKQKVCHINQMPSKNRKILNMDQQISNIKH